MFGDLHLHSHFSDGTYSPEEIASLGRSHGLGVLALTDHDTVEGCPRMVAACAREGIEFIPASELTAEHNGNELHLLGFFLDYQNPMLLRELARFQEVRQNRITEMVARLNQLGVPIQSASVFALANCRSPGRPHIARTLVQGGWCASLDEAFERFLKKGRPAWVPKFKMNATQAIELIHECGGLAVMAHPGLNRTDEIIPELASFGLDGIECFHTKHTPTMSELYVKAAFKYNLVVTGGSDCHGMSKGRPLIGTVKLPGRYIESLRERFEYLQTRRAPVLAQSQASKTAPAPNPAKA